MSARRSPISRQAPRKPDRASFPSREAIIVAFRQHTLLAFDDRLYPLQLAIAHLDQIIPATLPPAPRYQPIAGGRRREAFERSSTLIQSASIRSTPVHLSLGGRKPDHVRAHWGGCAPVPTTYRSGSSRATAARLSSPVTARRSFT